MTKEQLAALLNGREYPMVITDAEAKQAKKDGLVVVSGASDDLCELRGALYDEAGCCDGGILILNRKGFVENHSDCECMYCGFKEYTNSLARIEAIWDRDGVSWQYETSIPHATFDIMEDGEVYCRGLVLELAALPHRGV